MAKGHALIGKIKGRLGGAVYRVQDGKQIISERAITVLNPKSEKQILQRAIFGCASLVSKQLPFVTIAGWSPKPNLARAALVRSLMQAAVVDDTNPDSPIVTIEAPKVVLSNGGAIPCSGFDLVKAQDSLSLTCTAHVPAGLGVVAGMFVVLVFDNTSHECLGCAYGTHNYDDVDNIVEVRLEMDLTVNRTGKTFNAYFIPITDRTDYISTKYGSVVELLNGSDYSTQVAIDLSKRDLLAGSIYAGQLVINPA